MGLREVGAVQEKLLFLLMAVAGLVDNPVPRSLMVLRLVQALA